MRRQKAINKILRNVKSNRPVYNTFGTIIKVYTSTVLILVDFFVPSARLLTGLAVWLKKKDLNSHLFNIDITKIMECVRKCWN